jgi:hypothetical protein
MASWNHPNGQQDRDGDGSAHDPEAVWDLGELDDESYDDAGRRRVPIWLIVVAVLIALALIIQLAWPLVADLLDRGRDGGGFPTPGPV